MEELIENLQSSAIEVDGVPMVLLTSAVAAVQTAGALQMVESLDKLVADLASLYTDEEFIQDEEVD
jgi:hypothetical protein